MEKERLAFFAFAFLLMAVGGPCGFVEKYFTVANVTTTPLNNQTVATHLACQAGACVAVAGVGSDECGVDADCAAQPPSPSTHMACSNAKCVQAQGSGTDECASDADCAPAPPATHMACANNACVVVQGAGADSCSSNSDCAASQQPAAPQGASGCSQYTDCSQCLQGSAGACKWCIQGSVCAPAASTDQCFGGLGWLSKDFQCSLATR